MGQGTLEKTSRLSQISNRDKNEESRQPTKKFKIIKINKKKSGQAEPPTVNLLDNITLKRTILDGRRRNN